MKCIVCQKEIRKNQQVVFLFCGDLHPYPVCKKCVENSKKLQPKYDEEFNYTPGLIEDE